MNNKIRMFGFAVLILVLIINFVTIVIALRSQQSENAVELRAAAEEIKKEIIEVSTKQINYNNPARDLLFKTIHPMIQRDSLGRMSVLNQTNKPIKWSVLWHKKEKNRSV